MVAKGNGGSRMNKQEAIEKIKNLSIERNGISSDKGNLDGVGFKDEVSAWDVICILDKINESQKPVVPKFVAEWIKSQKESFSDTSAIDMYENLTSDNRSGYCHEVWLWVIAHHYDFIKAWHDGYEIEQEKLYTVEIPNPNRTTEPIIYLSRDGGGRIFLNSWFLYVSQNWENQPHARLTEAEIKKDFEWAFQFAKPVEEK